jgi:hypothetical protein
MALAKPKTPKPNNMLRLAPNASAVMPMAKAKLMPANE